LNIFAQKSSTYKTLVSTNTHLRRLIADTGGQCRCLEILYKSLPENDLDLAHIDWKSVAQIVRVELNQRYRLSSAPLGTAIAYSFLSWKVRPADEYPEIEHATYLDLEEKGLIKIEDEKVKVPYFFICSFLSSSKNTCYSSFWTDLFLGEDFWWQDWEIFNRNFIAFRLSLYSYLGHLTVSLKDFFAGAIMNIPVDFTIKIPSISDIKVSKIQYRYPATQATPFSAGDSVLNGAGSPFDSFMYVEDVTGNKLLLAFQMKLSNPDSRTPQVISNDTVNDEFAKIVANLNGTDFVCVVLGRCGSALKADTCIGSNCIVVTKNEQLSFYGQSYYNRLNN
jgi:hypothetical protein